MCREACRLLEKYRGFLLYVFFGLATTAVNIAVYFICSRMLCWGTAAGNMAAWLAAVSFAYVTNRIWVFESRAAGFACIAREAAAFFGCRIATGLLDMAAMLVCADVMGLDEMIVKCAANIMVILANYAAGRMIIFRR